MRIFLTQPSPTSKQESSEHLPLPWRSSQLFPKLVMTRVSWRNNNVCFFYLRDLSQMKDVTMTGPLWLVNKSYPEDLAWNRATSCCGLPTPFFSLS